MFTDQVKNWQSMQKWITVMNKDMECLRDIWATIDPSSPIGNLSALSRETRRRHDALAHRKLIAKREAALRKAKELCRIGQPIPCHLSHFLKNVPGNPMGRGR